MKFDRRGSTELTPADHVHDFDTGDQGLSYFGAIWCACVRKVIARQALRDHATCGQATFRQALVFAASGQPYQSARKVRPPLPRSSPTRGWLSRCRSRTRHSGRPSWTGMPGSAGYSPAGSRADRSGGPPEPAAQDRPRGWPDDAGRPGQVRAAAAIRHAGGDRHRGDGYCHRRSDRSARPQRRQAIQCR